MYDQLYPEEKPNRCYQFRESHKVLASEWSEYGKSHRIVTDTRNNSIDDCSTDSDLEIVCPVVLCLVMMLLEIIQISSQ